MEIRRETFYLNCNQQSFEDWFLSNYPNSSILGRGQAISCFNTAPGWDNISVYVAHVFEEGKHKFILEFKESRYLQFELFLSAIRNKFTQPEPEDERRRSQVRELKKQGLTIDQIALRVDRSKTTVNRDLEFMGLTKKRGGDTS